VSKVSRGLGRGFEALIPVQMLDEEFDPTSQQDEQVSRLRDLEISQVIPNPEQPRRNFEDSALQELAESIKEHGIMLPLVVTPKGNKFELVAGERRWRAAKIVGLKTVPALVRTLTNQHKLELSLIENLQREDLNPLETATAYLKLHQQFNLTYEEIGKRVGGKALSTVSNVLRLLGLPPNAKQALIESKITEGHARQILAIHEPDVQQELLELIIKNDWSVRKTEQFVVGYKEGSKDRKTAVAKVQTKTAETVALTKRLNTSVVIKNMANGGRLIIEYKSQKDLERIADLLLR
jgi:ParB family chromosome partitioning protein